MNIMTIKEYIDKIKSTKRKLNIEMSRMDVIDFALHRKEKYYADHYDDLSWKEAEVLRSDIDWLGMNIEFIAYDISWLIMELKDLYLYGY